MKTDRRGFFSFMGASAVVSSLPQGAEKGLPQGAEKGKKVIIGTMRVEGCTTMSICDSIAFEDEDLYGHLYDIEDVEDFD